MPYPNYTQNTYVYGNVYNYETFPNNLDNIPVSFVDRELHDEGYETAAMKSKYYESSNEENKMCSDIIEKNKKENDIYVLRV